MAHFAELNDENMVIRVIVVSDEDAGPLPGLAGEIFCANLLSGRWKQTSYNTRGGVHHDSATNLPDSGVAFRKNYAGSGYFYDESRDAFIYAQPFPSWIVDEDTCWWVPPVPQPIQPAAEGYYYKWDEGTLSWVIVPVST